MAKRVIFLEKYMCKILNKHVTQNYDLEVFDIQSSLPWLTESEILGWLFQTSSKNHFSSSCCKKKYLQSIIPTSLNT